MYFKKDNHLICIIGLEEIKFLSFQFNNNFFIDKNFNEKTCILNDEDIKFITYFTYLEENNLFCFGTSNNKLKLFKKNEDNNEEEEEYFKISQEIILENDSNYINNIIEFSKKIFISSDQNNIIIYKYENNNFIKKDIIKINNESYIRNINNEEFCALSSDQNLIFYKQKESKFYEHKKITGISVFISSKKKENNICNININKIALINNNLCICGNHNIYLVDIIKYEIINNIHLSYRRNFHSITNLLNDLIIIQEEYGKLYIFDFFEKEKLHYFDNLPDYGEAFITFPFGIKRVACHQTNIIKINNMESFFNEESSDSESEFGVKSESDSSEDEYEPRD